MYYDTRQSFFISLFSIYIFLKDKDCWRLFARTNVSILHEKLNFRIDDEDDQIVFETKYGVFGYFPFEWLSFGLNE